MKDYELTEPISVTDTPDDSEAILKARIDKLESESQEAIRQSERRAAISELKVAAVRAGMIDLDGLTFLDLTRLQLEDDGSVAGGADLIDQLKRTKPWLFMASSSSSTARVPTSRPNRQKLATEMTDEEYRIAKANIIKRSIL